MSELRPLGSEKLPVEEKLKRIMEIANYGRTPKTSINENKSHKNVEFLMESTNGMYGIVREGNSYYVQKGINESSLDYIGGMFMKDKNRFSSYSAALKRLELISGQETLNEAKRYVLKSKGGESSAPVEDIPAEPIADEPVMDAPIDDSPVGDPSIDGEQPIEDLPSDDLEGEEDGGMKSEYMDEVQKFSGKLGQALRDVKERMESDDIKYVINMVLSAINLDALDEDDREDIAEKFEVKEDEFGSESGEESDNEDEFGSEEDFDDEGNPINVDSELDEIMAKLESFVDTDAIGVGEKDEIEIEETADVDITQFNDLGMAETVSDVDEEVELDLDELKNTINRQVGETLSKYFK